MKLTAFLMGEESRGLVSFQNFKPKNVFLFNNNLKLIVPVLLQITNPGYSNCRRVSLAKDALFEMDCNLPNIRQFFFFFFFFFFKVLASFVSKMCWNRSWFVPFKNSEYSVTK